jgi:hypothetical protein
VTSLIAPDPVVVEAERLRVLRSFDILDTDPEQAFDDVMLLAARICDTPIGMVSLAVGDRQWFKAQAGVDVSNIGQASAFCEFAMLLSGVATVDDQAPSPLADTLGLSTSSDASLLFHGFDAGLEFKF